MADARRRKETAIDRAEVLIRCSRAGDQEHINNLFNTVFETDRALAQWRWKFEENPASAVHPANIVVGVAQGRTVSTLASMARDIFLRGAPHTAVQIVDTVIHPEFRRGRRLLGDMLAYFGEQMSARGIDFTFGCPNEVHYRVGKRLLGYTDLFSAKRLVRRLRLRPALRRRSPAPLRPLAGALGHASDGVLRLLLGSDARAPYREEAAADERFDALWQLAKQRFTLLGARDRKYLQWRYFSRPDARFRLLSSGEGGRVTAWVVLNVSERNDGSRAGYIVDFLYLEPAEMRRLLRHAVRELFRMRADHAIAVAAPGSEGEALLREAGIAERAGVEPVRMSVRWYAMQDEQHQRVICDPAAWHLCHGDLDLQL